MSYKNVLNIFEKIDTEEKAYWLGFLYADGAIGSKEDKIELGLAEKDLSQIEKFRSFTMINNKISYRPKTRSYRYSFRSQKCKDDLINKGCLPKKSLILVFPTENQVPQNLLRHFIRGYFDGDGWFSNTSECFQLGFIGTEAFIKGLLQRIECDFNKNNKILNVHRENGAKKYIINSYNGVLNFLNYIYKDANIYLNRKYDNYIDFITNGSKYHKSKQYKMPYIKEI